MVSTCVVTKMKQNKMEESDATNNTKFKDGVNRNARLIVRNISFKANEEDLRKHFSEYGTVEEVKLLRKPDGRLVGCGFVHYTHVPMANKAITATNRKPFMDRPLNVAWAIPRNKYGENSEHGAPRTSHNNDSTDEVTIKEEPEEGDTTNKKKDKARINRNARLVIRNVSFKATEDTLKEHFQPYGDILEVKLLKKPDGKLVGCAFVHFKNVPMAKKALLSTNMKPFLGRPISVDWAVAKDKYMQHIVNQQQEMQDNIKKEDSDDDDDDGPPLNISNDDLKQEVKSESDDESMKEESDSDEDIDSKKLKYEDDSDSTDEEDDDEDDDEDVEDDEDLEDNDDNQSQTSTQPEWKRTKLNDAEDGCTVFVTNLPFSVDDDQLRAFAEDTAPVKYALVCVDKLTEHSKGSGFIKFTNAEDADRFLALPADKLRLEGQVVQVKPALKRESLQKGSAKQPKDNRNLYLVKEGVVVAGTKAAVGVSASDMSKRLALERSKTQMLKNLNRFVSRYRLVVSNLPASCNDARLRRVCFDATGRGAAITEARVMRDLRAPLEKDGQHPSKGYGFVMFTRHEDALACLRKLNNNPDIFDKNNRPIVSFSIEDRTALNARKKRLEKSIANNPQGKNFNNAQGNFNNPKGKNNFNNAQGRNKFNNNAQGKNNLNNNMQGKNNAGNEAFKNRKRKSQAPPDENHGKKGKFENNKMNRKQQNHNGGNFVKKPRGDGDVDEYAGLTAKEGAQHKMRSSHKLKTQADVHRQQVKMEKKNSQRSKRLKMAARERMKQPKQKINKNAGKNKRKKFKSNDIRDILK